MLNLLERPCFWWEIHRLRVFSLAYKCLFYVKNNKASIQLNSSMCLISRPNFYVKSNWIICYLQTYMYKHHHRLFIFFWRKGEGTDDFYYMYFVFSYTSTSCKSMIGGWIKKLLGTILLLNVFTTRVLLSAT